MRAMPDYRVDEHGCWIWLKSLCRDGYARSGTRRRSSQAHRVYFENHRGPIPKGKEIDHLCRVRNCVNPQHMEPVLHKENLMRGESFSAINSAKTQCIHGHSLSGSNLKIETHRGQKRRVCWKCRQVTARRTWQRNKARAEVERLEK